MKLEFKEVGHKHILNGQEVPGCTSVSALFDDDGWKFAWPVKEMEKKLLETWYIDQAYSQKEIHAMLKEAKNAWRKKRDKSADTGTLAHAIIEEYIKTKVWPKITNPEIQNIVMQFIQWETKYKPKWIASELQVGSEIHMFAGILDALCEIDGALTLVDFKTSKDIKPSYNIQLAGLVICLIEMKYKIPLRAILHLPKTGDYEYRIITDDLQNDAESFLSGLDFLKHKNKFLGRHKTGSPFQHP